MGGKRKKKEKEKESINKVGVIGMGVVKRKDPQ